MVHPCVCRENEVGTMYFKDTARLHRPRWRKSSNRRTANEASLNCPPRWDLESLSPYLWSVPACVWWWSPNWFEGVYRRCQECDLYHDFKNLLLTRRRIWVFLSSKKTEIGALHDVAKRFRPEFINRANEQVVFQSLESRWSAKDPKAKMEEIQHSLQ